LLYEMGTNIQSVGTVVTVSIEMENQNHQK